MNKLKKIWVAVFLLCVFASVTLASDGDIAILYTNDVHSHVDTNIGYAGVAAMKQQLEAEGTAVLLVDCGDILQGDVLCAVSKGKIPMKLFDMAGYDFFTLGNHEFDYGTERLAQLLNGLRTPCLNCNIVYTGSGRTPKFLSKLKPYAIKEIAGKRIAFIGVATPDTVTSSSPENFIENRKIAYSFFGGHKASDEGLSKNVQQYVNECRHKGVDYVVILSHLGDSASRHTSRALIRNSYGIDIVLDGHDHHVIPGDICKNKDSKSVLLTSTGTAFANVGKVIISKDGKISSELISNFTQKEPKLAEEIAKQRKQTDKLLSKQIGYADFALPITSQSGARLLRCRETGIGNFCADAFAHACKTQIALINGGGIRTYLPQGKITVKNVLNIMPFSNAVVSVKMSGSDLLDALEVSCSAVQKKSEENGNAIGENGGFFSVHGVRFFVDTSVPTPARYDETKHLWTYNGKRRVSDVWLVDENGKKIEKISRDKSYSVAMSDFTLNGGDSYSMFKKYRPEIVLAKRDYEVLCDFIKNTLGGKIPKRYSAAEGRISIK